MPTNLPAEYYDAEKRYRDAGTITEKIEYLEEMLSTIPKHKGTDKLRADYRKRLSKLKASTQSRKGSSKRESVYSIDREGAGQIVLVGHANVGKSSIVEKLTNASPEIAPYPFSTWKPTPGMMFVDNVQIQLIDTPAINKDYLEGDYWNLVRRSDLILLVLDLQADPEYQLHNTVDLLEQHRVISLHIHESIPGGKRVFIKPYIVLVNKTDHENHLEDYEIFCELLDEEWPMIPVSALTGYNIDSFKKAAFDELRIIRIYSQPPGGEADFKSPFTMKRGGTVNEFARKIHQDFHMKLKSARVWGSADFEGQMVQRDYILQDGDVVELKI